MIRNPNYLVGTIMLATSFLFTWIFYETASAFSASPYPQGNLSRDLPTLDYEIEVSKPKSKDRREKGNHFKGSANPDPKKPIDELPEGVEPLPITGAWWRGLSALPTEQSDVVVLGFVNSREAHLSEDRTGIYSEFTMLVSEVFKDPAKTIISGTPISVNRPGGSVRFNSGRIQTYEIAYQGMPQVAAQYVLFLRQTANGDLLIITGFKLINGHTTPLDGNENNDPRLVLPFEKYAGADDAQFLKEVRNATAQERTENPFETVPMELRPRLVERLREYVTDERTRQYENLFALLYDRKVKGDDKKAYSTYRLEAQGRSGVVQEFTPTFIMDITMNDGDAPTFNLIGRAKVISKGRTREKQMAIHARLQDGEWYFTELSNVYLHID